jgi:hypothetical protein
MAKTKWWKNMKANNIVAFQLFEPLLCMDFTAFHKAVEESLGRSVFTHEFRLNLKGLQDEFLGKRPKATLEEIISLIPEYKRIILVA